MHPDTSTEEKKIEVVATAVTRGRPPMMVHMHFFFLYHIPRTSEKGQKVSAGKSIYDIHVSYSLAWIVVSETTILIDFKKVKKYAY